MSTSTFDENGRTLSRADTFGNTTRQTYDIRGNLETLTDPRLHVTRFASEPRARTTIDALGNTTISNQSGYGLPTNTVFPPGDVVTSSAFNGLTDSGQYPLTETDELGRDRTFAYDPNSVLQSVTDLGGNAWQYGHRVVLGGAVHWDIESGEVGLGADDAGSPVSRFAGRSEERDAERPAELDAWTDHLEQVTSPEGETTRWHFGAGGHVDRVEYPYGGTLSRTYGADLRIATETRPFGNTLTFARDSAGRITARTGTDGSSHTWTYGAGDRVDTMTDATGATTYQYDSAGRFRGLEQPRGGGWSQGYDAESRVTTARVHGSWTADSRSLDTGYTYDAVGNLETITDPFGRVTRNTYDVNNRLSTTTLPNGVTSTYAYDERSRVSSIVHAASDGSVLASVAYLRSPSGEPTRITREDASYVELGYDPALRLASEDYYDATDTRVDFRHYTYDRDGNRLTRNTPAGLERYFYDTGSRLVRIERGTETIAEYTYDTGGRVTRIVREGRTRDMAYDADDHVVELTDSASGETHRYGFDAAGRRTSRSRLAGAALIAALSFVTAPTLAAGLDSPHAVMDETGAPTTGYVFDGEHPLARYEADTGEPVYYLRDAMGSVIGLVDGDAGESARIHYDGFGLERVADGELAALSTGNEGDFRFQGMWLNPTGEYYVRARTYEPESGRFLTRDSAPGDRSDPPRFTPYVFTRSNAMVWLDPAGLNEMTMPGIFTGLAAADLLQISTFALRAVLTAAIACVASAVGTTVVEDVTDSNLSDGPCDPPNSCDELYRGVPECDDPDFETMYPYDSAHEALETIDVSGARLGPQQGATSCPSGSTGDHWDVLDAQGRKVNSIVCCTCCDDASGSLPASEYNGCGTGRSR